METAKRGTDVLEQENEIMQKLAGRLGLPQGKYRASRPRRLWAEAPRERFHEALAFARDELGFSALCAVTGLDAGEAFELIYHVAREDGCVLSLREAAPKDDPTFDTATDLYAGGALFELEARNLLGLAVRGVPDDIRYPLPDGWPEGQHPLRKSWTGAEGEGMA